MIKWLTAALAVVCLAASAQTTQPLSQPHVTFVDASGLPCSACQLFTYAAGTTTPLATYSNAGGTPNTNPIILDAAGGATVWLGSNSYKFVLETPLGATIWTTDQVSGWLNAVVGKYLPVTGGTLTGALTGTTISASVNGVANVTTYGVDCTGSVDSTSAFQAAVNAASAVGGQAYIPANCTIKTSGVTITLSNYGISISGASNETSLINLTGSRVFTFSGTTTGGQFNISNVGFIGTGGAGNTQQVLAPGDSTFQYGGLNIDDIRVYKMGHNAIDFGLGNWPWTVSRSIFQCNPTDQGGTWIHAKSSSEGIARDNQFATCAEPSIVLDNDADRITIHAGQFSAGLSDTVVPDIQLTPSAVGFSNPGAIAITGVTFASDDAGEVTGRPRIRCGAAGNTNTCGPTVITGNFFYGKHEQIAIALLSPIEQWDIASNVFEQGYSTIIDDAFTVTDTNAEGSVFSDNTMPALSVPIFTHGGRGFGVVRAQGTTGQLAFSQNPRDNETLGLENRIEYSETFTNGVWNAAALNATVTPGQTDPFGTSRASLITVAGISVTDGLVNANISNANLSSDGYWLSFWAKAGTLNTMTFQIQTGAARPQGISPVYNLSSTWKHFAYYCAGCLPINELLITPGISFFGPPQAGSIYLFGVQMSNNNSDYIATTSSALFLAGGNEWQQPVRAQAGVILPASCSGLISGTLYNNAGTPAICP